MVLNFRAKYLFIYFERQVAYLTLIFIYDNDYLLEVTTMLDCLKYSSIPQIILLNRICSLGPIGLYSPLNLKLL